MLVRVRVVQLVLRGISRVRAGEPGLEAVKRAVRCPPEQRTRAVAV
jgi:hypothetical protein